MDFEYPIGPGKMTRKQKHDRLFSMLKEIEVIAKKYDCRLNISVECPDDRFDKLQPLGLVISVNAEFTPLYDMFRSTLLKSLKEGK